MEAEFFVLVISRWNQHCGVWDGTKYQVELAYYESACLNHHSLFCFILFSPQQGLKMRNRIT